jgi:phenylalanyl-tRNA synthetase beta chain
VATRLTAQRHKLPTDAAKRYENGLSRSVTPYGLQAGAKLIAEIAGGTVVGATSAGDSTVARVAVSVSVPEINRVLGISVSTETVSAIFHRFGYIVVESGDVFVVTPPHERDDLLVKQDLIEEVGRMYGLSHIVSIPPTPVPVQALNIRHFYAEQIRDVLIGLGFSEIYTSSFRNQDIVKIQNALASDKSYLRSMLHENLREAVQKNSVHRDLLGLNAIKLFEIGTVFTKEGEYFRVGLGVQAGSSYKAKTDDLLLKEAQEALTQSLGVVIEWEGTQDGVTEFTLDTILAQLPAVTAYTPIDKTTDVKYEPFSLYPSVSRDIAMWVSLTVTADTVSSLLKEIAGELCVRITLFDTFIKEERTSLAFRLVFQSKTKTLETSEVDTHMSAVYDAVAKAGFAVR